MAATNTSSLTDFQRNAELHLKRLRETGEPEVLTVNGQPELVIQSASAYEKLLARAEQIETVQILRERIIAADAGEPGISSEQVLAEIEGRLNAGRPL